MHLGARLLLALCAAIFLALFLILRRRDDLWDPVNFIFYLFTLQYLVPALLFVVWPTSSLGSRWGITDETLAWLVPAFLMVLGFLVFFWMGSSALATTGQGGSWEWSPARIRAISYLWLATFTTIVAVYVFVLGGLTQLSEHFQLAEGTGWITPLMVGSSHFLPMLLWTVGLRRLAISVVLVLSAFFLASGGRMMSALVLFWFLMFVYYLDGKRWINGFVFLAPLFLPLSVYVVLAPYVEGVGIDALLSYNWQGLFQFEVGRLEQLAVYLWYSLETPYFDLGRSWLMGLLGPLLPAMFNLVDYRNVISARLMGLDPATFRFGMGGTGVIDLWMQGALGAVFLGAFAYGFVWRRAYVRMKSDRNPFYVLLHIQVTIFLFQAIHEGMPLGLAWFTLIPFGLLALAAGVRRRESAEPAASS